MKERRADFWGMLVALHRARGLHHEPAAYKLWGALVGLVSVGLVSVVPGRSGGVWRFQSDADRVDSDGAAD